MSRLRIDAVVLALALLLTPALALSQTTESLVPLSSLGRVELTGNTARLTINNQTYTFELNSPFFKSNGKIYQLISPATKSGTEVLVSKQFKDEFISKSPAARVPQPATRDNPATAPAPAPAGKVVVIDAGHGGKDPGKIGPNGLAEKTVTLTVANKLAALLKDAGYEVHMTRTTDTLISLADRPRFANQWKNNRPATLFVSIHANAGVAAARGFETYFLSEARTADERRVAEMENAAVAYEEKKANAPALEQLLTGLRNDYYQRASNDFAEVIQQQLAPFHPGPTRGVKQAGFRVLVGAVMPAVLVEIAFISNPGEAQLLGTSAFQDKIAYSLSRSIKSFFESHAYLWTSEPAQ